MYAILSLSKLERHFTVSEFGFYESLDKAKQGLADWVNHLFPGSPTISPAISCCRHQTIFFIQPLTGALPGLLNLGFVPLQSFTVEETKELEDRWSFIDEGIKNVRPVQIGEPTRIETTAIYELIGYDPESGKPIATVSLDPEDEFEQWTLNGKPVFALSNGKVAVNDEPDED